MLHLAVLSGPQAGDTHRLSSEGELIVGSADDADVRLGGSRVAPRHLKLRVRDGLVEVDCLALAEVGRLRAGEWETVANLAYKEVAALPPGVGIRLGDAVVLLLRQAGAPERSPGKKHDSEKERRLDCHRCGKTVVPPDAAIAADRYVVHRECAGDDPITWQLSRQVDFLGTGLVFEARKPLLPPAAVKIYPATHRRSRSEIRALGRIEHPGIHLLRDALLLEGSVALVFEWVDGMDLQTLTEEKGRWAADSVCHMLGEACDIMAYAHSRDVIHRDLRPANIVRLKDRTYKISGFGLAKFRDDDLTRTGTVLGEGHYIAPEQIKDSSRVDWRADIYSLAATACYLLLGTAPFPGENLIETFKLKKHPETALAGIENDVLQSVLRESLDPDPNKRPVSMQVLKQKLPTHVE